jgi:glycosyltransferase involved in cell wall biosynthesis
MQAMRKVVLVGPFPPPMHGMAAVNAAVRRELERFAAEIVVIDTAHASLSRSLLFRLRRLPKVLAGLVRLAFLDIREGAVLYMSVSGGVGQVYEILFVLISRLHKMKILLHHHSFAYLYRPSWITSLLIAATPRHALHIGQSKAMVDRLKIQYGVKRVMSVSNVVFLDEDFAPRPRIREKLETMGFISNISSEKGIFEFLDLARAVKAEGMKINAMLAGPFEDAYTESRVRERLAKIQDVIYVGPKIGQEKKVFFDSIDLLIFPTRYLNETEGIVNLEAMSGGIPVIAYGRGSIPEVIGPESGLIVDPAQQFVPAAITKIKEWLGNPSSFQQASSAAAKRFAELYITNLAHREELLREIVSGASDEYNYFNKS